MIYFSALDLIAVFTKMSTQASLLNNLHQVRDVCKRCLKDRYNMNDDEQKLFVSIRKVTGSNCKTCGLPFAEVEHSSDNSPSVRSVFRRSIGKCIPPVGNRCLLSIFTLITECIYVSFVAVITENGIVSSFVTDFNANSGNC